MFSKATRPGEPADTARPSSVASLVAEGVTIEGDLSTAGDLHLDGSLHGDVKAGRLTLGESGSVTGGILAESVEVRGHVAGTITARQVRLCASARVDGDITHGELSIEAGAHFVGRSQALPEPETTLSVVAAE